MCTLSPRIKLLITTLMLLCCITACRQNDEPPAQKKSSSSAHQAAPKTETQLANKVVIEPIIVFEEPYDTDQEEPTSNKELTSSGQKKGSQNANTESPRPKVAIIIDDMGYHKTLGAQLLALDLNLTYAFLPEGPHTKEQAQKAYALGRDILVHMPMQPKSAQFNPGENVLRLGDAAADRIQNKMAQMFSAVPHAIGTNNHMGSLFTESPKEMTAVIHELRQKGYFFIDSYTTAKTVGFAMAKKQGVPTAKRDVFLDNVRDPKKICEQIERLLALAKKKGTAIAIGHPNKATLIALTECNRGLLDSVNIVNAHELLQ